MKMISTHTMREGLRYGSNLGYTLFPEIRKQENLQKVQSHPVTSSVIAFMLEYAEEIMREPAPRMTFAMFKEYDVSGSRLEFEVPFFERRRQLEALVLLTLVEDTDRYLSMIEERLWEWCDMYTWETPAHIPMSVEAISQYKKEPDTMVALYSATMAFYFAELLSLLGDKLHSMVAYRLRKEIFRRVLHPFMERIFGFEGTRMNWASVVAGQVGCAAIYMIEDEEILIQYLQRVIGAMASYLEGFDKDGVTTEGLGYWQYGFSPFIFFAELLRERTGGKVSLLEWDEKIKKIAELPTVLSLSNGLTVNFSDAPVESKLDYGVLARLATRLGIEGYSFKDIIKPDRRDLTFREMAIKFNLRSLFWGLDFIPDYNSPVKDGMFFFPESQWLIDRRMMNDIFVAFAAKGGHNNEPHNHNDIGNFILHYRGKNVLADLGQPEYVKAYFREKRYEFLCAASLGHSVPVINGVQQGAGQEYQAKVLQCEQKEGRVNYRLDLKEAYPAEKLTGFERAFVWDYEKLDLKITDHFEFSAPQNTIVEVFVTKDHARVVEPGKVLIHSEVCEVEVLFDRELPCEVILEQYRERDGKDAVAYRICITNTWVGEKLEQATCIRIIPKKDIKECFRPTVSM